MQEKINSLKQEIAEFKSQIEKINKERDAKKKEIEESEEYKSVKAKVEELTSNSNRLSTKESEREKQIKERFINFRSSDSWARPSYSQTYGRNIKENVISAIKKTFDFKKLSDGTVEGIVSNMISNLKQKDESLAKIGDEKRLINIESYKIEGMLSNLRKPAEDINSKKYQLENNISEKEKEIVTLIINQEKTSASEMKQLSGLDNKYTKKRALADYRDKCEQEFRKVFDNLVEEDD